MAIEIDTLKNRDNHRLKNSEEWEKWNLHKNIRLSYTSASEPNPSLHHAFILDEVKTNVGGGSN